MCFELGREDVGGIGPGGEAGACLTIWSAAVGRCQVGLDRVSPLCGFVTLQGIARPAALTAKRGPHAGQRLQS